MLPKAQRFSRESFPKGRPSSRRSFVWGTVSYYPGSIGSAVVVSKKTLKKAHDRNRARRRLYAALQQSSKVGVVIHARREALTVPLTTLIEDLKNA